MLFLLLVISLLNAFRADNSSYIPQQVHSSFGRSKDSLVIGWITFEPYNNSILSIVLYGYTPNELIYKSTNVPTEFIGLDPPTRIIHRVELSNLNYGPNVTVYYKCGNSLGIYRNKIFSQELLYYNSNTYINFASFGDFGIEYANPNIHYSVYDSLYNFTLNNSIDFMIHMGDIAYDLHTDNGTLGDEYMNGIENLTTIIPYMTGVGCHERDDRWVIDSNVSYGNYLNRFNNLYYVANESYSTSLHYYSFDVKNIHFISIDTDPWVYMEKYTNMYDIMTGQWSWLLNDLENINRNITPWIIIYQHRSMYCTKFVTSHECTLESEQMKNGIINPVTGLIDWALEPLYYQYGVDLILSGHTHHYERTWPVYENITSQFNYNNPKSSVYVLNGIAGVTSSDRFGAYNPKWLAYRDMEYRRMYGLITVYNNTHLHYKAIDNSSNLFDEFIIIQNYHGSFNESSLC